MRIPSNRRPSGFAWLFAALAAASTAGCATAVLRVSSLDDVERIRTTDPARDAARLAGDAYAHAEQLRDQARRAHAERHDADANLLAERAIVAYQRAVAVARGVRAVAEAAAAQKALDDANAQLQSLDGDRAALEREAADLETRVRAAREKAPAAGSAPTAERSAAQRDAARSLAVEARLLCGAARLLLPTADDLDATTASVATLNARLESPGGQPKPGPASHAAGKPGSAPPDAEKPGPTSHAAGNAAESPPSPLDDAARARERCLAILTRIRRGTAEGAGQEDGLLTELSAAGGLDPSRDDRGIVVTLRGAYRGTALAEDSKAKLAALGRVAAAHPAFAVQIVVHDAAPPAPSDDADARRADLAVRALIEGGAAPARVHAELAGARLDVADPNDARVRSRNERLDVVFVGP